MSRSRSVRHAWGLARVAALLLLPCAVARADDEPGGAVGNIDSGLNLDQLLNLRVVTASGGVEEERSLAPASVVVFTRDDIARQGWRSLTDVLENTPGMDVVDDQVMASVGVRGVTGGFRASTRLIKVMIDGVAVNFRPDLAAFIGPEFIPVEVIDRVEIAKGPLSAIYGANAFLAVVNVITVKAADIPLATINLRSNLIRSAVGYGASAIITESTGPLEIVAAFSVDRIDRSGLRIARTIPNQDPELPRYQPFFAGASQNDIAQPRSAFLSLRLPLNHWGSITLEGGLQQLDSMGEFQLNSVLTHRSRVAIDNFWSAAHYEKAWSDRLRLTATLGYSTGEPTRDEALYLTANYLSSFAPQFRYQALDAGFQLAFTPARRLSVVVGADTSYEPQRALFYTQTFQSVQGMQMPGDTIDVNGGPNHRDFVLRNAGVHAQVTAVPLARVPALHLTVSGRLDVPTLFSVQYSWRTAVAYRVSPGLTMKIFAGRAFQVPSAVLLYGRSGFGAANNVIGNRTVPGLAPLRPQVINSLEAAVSASPSRVLLIETNMYYQQIQERIEFSQAGADFIARNQGQGSNLGLEMSARALFYRLRPYLGAAAQRTLVSGSLDSRPPALYPNYWFRGGAEVAVPELHLRTVAQLRWVGARSASQSNILLNNNRPYQLPAIPSLDVTISSMAWRPVRSGPEVAVMLRAQNLLDDRKPVPGFGGMDPPSLGRVTMLQVGYTH
jgi:outer membrane receptor protein involved in Fe transport